MRHIIILFAFLGSAAAAQVQTLELKEHPPLKPLNWCTDSNGVTRSQIEPCGPGTTVGSSISTAKPNVPQDEPAPVAATPTATHAATPVEPPVLKREITPEPQEGFWKKWGKWLGIAVLAGLVIGWYRRSA